MGLGAVFPKNRCYTENFIQIGLVVGLGVLFRRVKAFPEQTAQVLNRFARYVALPAVNLHKVPQLHFSGALLVPAVAAGGSLSKAPD